MNNILTPVELQQIKFALGLNNNCNEITKNFFFSRTPNKIWEELISKGVATIKHVSKDGIFYTVTKYGIDTYLKFI